MRSGILLGVGILAFSALLLALGALSASTSDQTIQQAVVLRPTPEQQQYERDEIVALIHFNMATFFREGDPACNETNWPESQKPASFAPTNLSIDNWIESFKQLGAKRAVLTAKHGCGHCLWPTKVRLPDGRPYGYSVGTPQSYIKYDLLALFSEKVAKAGMGHGFYYSFTNNYYLNIYRMQINASGPFPGQQNVTLAQWENIAYEHVKEIWSNYGQLSEIWIDGGLPVDLMTRVRNLIAEKQPHAVGFGGYNVSRSPLRFSGTERADQPYPLWSCSNECAEGNGQANGNVWCPPTCDTTLQAKYEGNTWYPVWFWVPNTAIRSLPELIDLYHTSIGQSCTLEMDYAIDRQGLVDPTHAARYKEFGDWIRTCYGGSGVAHIQGPRLGTEFVLRFAPTQVDRVVIQEDQTEGQRIRVFNVFAKLTTGQIIKFTNGTAVGHKRIALLPVPVVATELYLEIVQYTTTPILQRFAVYAPCPRGVKNAGVSATAGERVTGIHFPEHDELRRRA